MTTRIYTLSMICGPLSIHMCVYMWTYGSEDTWISIWLLTWTHLDKYMQIYLLITHRLYPSTHTGLYLVMYSYVWSYTGLYLSIHRDKIYHTQACIWTYMNLGRLDGQLFCFMWLKSLSVIQLMSGLSGRSKMISLIWMVPWQGWMETQALLVSSSCRYRAMQTVSVQWGCQTCTMPAQGFQREEAKALRSVKSHPIFTSV